eukprot:145183_1
MLNTDEAITKSIMEKKKNISQLDSGVIGSCDDHFPPQKDKKEKEQNRKRKHPESEANDTPFDKEPPKKKLKIDDNNKQQPLSTKITKCDDIVLTREQMLNQIEYLQLSLLSKFNNHLQHAFFTRNGGVSTDEGVQSLNVLFSKE